MNSTEGDLWFKMPADISLLTGLPPSEIKAYIVIAHDIQRGRGAGRLSAADIAARVPRMTRSTAQRAADALVVRNLIHKEGNRPGVPPLYRLAHKFRGKREQSDAQDGEKGVSATAHVSENLYGNQHISCVPANTPTCAAASTLSIESKKDIEKSTHKSESFARFCFLFRQNKNDIIPSDFDKAVDGWELLSTDQQAEAIANIERFTNAGERIWCMPQRYLKDGEWQRQPKGEVVRGNRPPEGLIEYDDEPTLSPEERAENRRLLSEELAITEEELAQRYPGSLLARNLAARKGGGKEPQ